METSDNISYIYDVNGNMVADKNKGITLIEYNDFNLPTKIHFSTEDQSGKYIEYVYDASGVKLRKLVKDETQSNYHISLYAGAYIYEQTTSASSPSLKFILQPEGYFEPTGTSPSGELEGAYVYQYKDHLGNIRLSYKDNNGNLEIVEENNYYPFGLKHKGYNNVVSSTNPALKRKYNGIELEDALGLDLYEMDWRAYDPSIGRFNSIDLFAEYMYSHTPYHFSYNSPIYFSDPSGLCPNEDCDNTNGLDEGAEASSSEGTNWIVKDGKWVPTNAIGLDEVIVEGDSKSENSSDANSGSKKSGNNDFLFISWGINSYDHFPGESNRRHLSGSPTSVSVTDMSGLFTKAGRFWDIIILDLKQRIGTIKDYFSDTYSPSTGSIENSNKEPFDPPEKSIYYLYIHESYIGPNGERVSVNYINVEGNYGGYFRNNKNIKTLNEIRKDSIKEMKHKFNPKLPSRRRDSVTIEKKCCF